MARAKKQKATLADYAALEFEADVNAQEVITKLSDQPEWMEFARSDWLIMQYAAATLNKSAAELGRLASEPEAAAEFLEAIQEVQDRHEAIAGLARTASVRLIAGLSKRVLSEATEVTS